MTAIASTGINPAQPSSSESSRAAPPDLFTALLGSAGTVAPRPSTDAAAIGRLGSTPAKRTKKPAELAALASNPTNIAVAELASRGTPKASVQAATQEGTSPGRAPVSPGKKSQPDASPEKPVNRGPNSSSPRILEQPRDRSSSGAMPPPPSPTQAGPIPGAVQLSTSAATLRAGGGGAVAGAGAISRLIQAATPRGAISDRAQLGRANVRPVLAPHAQQRAEAKTALKAPPPSRPENQEAEFAEQLGRGFAAVLRQNGGSLTLRLEPEALGEMTIRMDLGPGKVTAAFEVESDQARQLLDANMSALRSALEARGLNVDSLTVQMSERSTPEALAARAEPGSAFGGAGNPEGGATGRQGGQGTDRPTADGAMAPARSAESTRPEAGATGVDQGGAQVLRLALDAIA